MTRGQGHAQGSSQGNRRDDHGSSRQSFGERLAAKMQQTKVERLTTRLHASASARSTGSKGTEERQETGAREQQHGSVQRLTSDDIKAVREHVRGWTPEQVRESTRDRYSHLTERMQRTGQRPEQIAHTKNSYYTYRAAAVHAARTELRTALRDRDAATRTHDSEQKLDAETRIKASSETLAQYAPGTGDRTQDMQRTSLYTGAAHSERSNGKRDALNSRPNDWRDRVFAEVQPRDRDAVAVTALTGARPAEVERGVTVRNTGEILHIKIQGAKCNGNDRGQQWREISISYTEASKSTEGRHLLEQVKPGRESIIKIGDTGNFSDRVRSASDRAMPDQQKPVSPYDYRHAFSARLKADERLSASDRAAAMGQQSERSQSEYGTASQASKAGAGSISSIRASANTRN